jgi:inosine/xanthosine triphosphatase
MGTIGTTSSDTPLAVSRVTVGSSNPVKIAAVRAVAARVWSEIVVDGVAVPSDVPDQPWGDEQTIAGARTRAERALAASDCDLAIGIEGGVVLEADGSMRTCAWAVAISRDGRVGRGGSLAMPLPPSVAAAVRGGLELGRAMDDATGERDTKRGAGAVGILTAGLIDRQRAYEVLVSYALAPWLAGALWR